MELTRELAKLIHKTEYEAIPPEVVQYAKLLVLSTIGASLAGSREPAGRIITEYVRTQGGTPEAGVFGAGFRTTLESAVLANNTLWHCTELEGNCYPECVSVFMLVPSFMGVAERFQLSGRKVIEACIVAHEVQGRLGQAANPDPDGPDTHRYMNMNTMGSVAIASGIAKLLGFDNEKTAIAISLAASQATGIGMQTGSMAHYVESGFAGRAGVAAALLANAGMTGRVEILETPRGLLDIWTGGGDYSVDRILGAWGKPFRVMGEEEKLFPCCSLMNHIIEAVVKVKKEHGLSYENVAAVEVETNRLHAGFCRFQEPSNPDEAKFSISHGVAVAVVDEKLSLPSFGLSRFSDRKVSSMRERVKVRVHPEWEAGNLAQPHPITITLGNGRQLHAEARSFHGHPPDLQTQPEFVERFERHAAVVLSPSQTAECRDLILNLDDVKNVTTLTTELTYPRKNG